MNLRKVVRWVVNIGSLSVAVAALPQFGALVPETWLPAIGSGVAVANMILSWLRAVCTGEGLFRGGQ